MTESQQGTAQVSLIPKTVGATTDITRRLINQASIDAELFVRNDLAAVLALALDYAGLHGTGSANQPLGVHYTTGIGSVAGGANGAAPDWADIVDLEKEVAVDNADIGSLAYITNAAVVGALKKTARTATYGDLMVIEPTAAGPGRMVVNGYPLYRSNQVASNLTKGSGTDLSAIFFGNWNDLLIGLFSGLDILVDPYTLSRSGGVRITALQDVDIAVRHAESFAAMFPAASFWGSPIGPSGSP